MDRDVGGTDFESFASEAQPRLVKAFIASRGIDAAADAAAEAMAYAFEHWDRVRAMENPTGYLYRVGQSKTRVRPVPSLPEPETIGVPEVEPALIPALLALPDTQRTAVWLVHACEWRYAEVAEAMGTSFRWSGIT